MISPLLPIESNRAVLCFETVDALSATKPIGLHLLLLNFDLDYT